ncbi:CapA family protein [Lachnospira multipara]|uniref:CapA family protein n=1 Tax=Lachnospira multipara TaxID=28051 RepID=UPI0006877C7C|nr:CapA family protein [Lachnospira multipara]
MRRINVLKKFMAVLMMTSLMSTLFTGCSAKKDENSVEPDAVVEETQTEADAEIDLIMVGDILLHTPIEEYSKQADGTYDYSAIFTNQKEDISDADLSLVNQEVIIGGEDLGISGYPAFNCSYNLANNLESTGFNVILHATNHALDKGKKGVVNCLNNWKTNHPNMTVLGINDSKEASDNIYVYEKDGMKIAILNYTYGTNGIPLPSDMPYAVNMLEEDKVVADIAKAKEISDFVVVCPHWGTEYLLGTDSMQKKWTKIFMDNGVDLVIGTHPHVIEPIEMLTDETTGHQMLVYYSLGNFVNWTSSTGSGISDRMLGGMAKVKLGRDDNGNVVIKDYGVKAIVSHVTSKLNGITVYNLSDYTDELAKENEIIKQDSNFSKEYLVNLANKVWGENNWE